MSRNLADVVREALAELPEGQQAAFALMVLHGVPMRKVSAEGGGDFGTLQGHVTSAMKHVKKRLDEAGLGTKVLVSKL